MDIQVNFYEIVATVLTFLAVFLLAIPKRLGYIVATLSQFFWILFAINQKHYVLAFQAIVLIGVNFYGTNSWKKKGVGD